MGTSGGNNYLASLAAPISAPEPRVPIVKTGGVMRTWKHDPPRRPGRLESDCSAPLADQRRVLLVGENDDWRLLTSYLFEDAGYTAYAAADGRQAVMLIARLLPDVVVVQMDAPDGSRRADAAA